MLFPAEVLPDTTIKGTQTDIGGVQDVPLGGSFDAAITFVAAGGDDGGEDPSGDADDPAGIPPEVVRNAEERMRSPVPHQQSDCSDESGTFGWGAEYRDGFGLFQVNDLVHFIVALTTHAAHCGGQVELLGINFREGAAIAMKFRCWGCGEDEEGERIYSQN